jgi:flavin reductase (DIM6/NTAB) family NADH-FMN oxidoreductase RutF
METIPESEKLRKVAGAFATGIAVVSLEDENQETLGMTVNSFLSVSLDPPLVLFSAGNNSRMLPYCKQDTALSINILSYAQKHISDHFAGFVNLEDRLKLKHFGDFVRIPEACAWYETRIEKLIDAGDHKLILCRIIDCERDEAAEPILFYKGYRTIGQEILK